MFKKALIFTGFFISGTTIYAAPISFSTRPSFPQTVSPSGTATLTYEIQNHISVTHPLSFSAQVTSGSITATGGTCGSTLTANASCTKIFTYTAPASAGTATGSVIVDYGGRNKLQDKTLNFSISNGTGVAHILITPNAGGVAYGGIDGTHAGTEPFTATEIMSDGSINTGATFNWSISTNPSSGVATINSSTGLVTAGNTNGTATVTAQDSSDSTISSTATLTVKKIGDSQSGGLVYCMGTGTDITNCAYLPSGKIGGVIATSDASASIQWDTSGTYTETSTSSPNDGATNTALLAADSKYAAANLCSSPWYLPAINELSVIGKNTIALNNASAGLNVLGISYWSSTQYTNTSGSGAAAPNYVWLEPLHLALPNIDTKGTVYSVRCAQTF